MTDYSEEIAFWERYLSRDHVPAMDPELRAGFFPDVMLPCLYETRAGSPAPPRLLDVGAGPISQLAWAVDQALAEVVGVDPLAGEYARLLSGRGMTYPVVPLRGAGEDLLQLFRASSFDLIYSGNALDHVDSPARCLAGMHAVLKAGGFLVVVSALREGTHQRWQGLHQHDLVPEGADLVRYDRTGSRSNLTGPLGFRRTYTSISGHEPGDEFVLVFRKVASPAASEPVPARYGDLLHYWMKKHAPKELRRTDPARRERDFPELLARLRSSGWLPPGGGVPRVLEVGSGPLSRLAFAAEHGLMDLMATDPLADVYADLMQRHGYDYPVRPVRVDLDDLAAATRDRTFDLVYAGDTLEYTRDPRAAVTAMASTLAPGGVLALEGASMLAASLAGPATRVQDLVLEGGSLHQVDADGTRLALTDGLGLDVLEVGLAAAPGGYRLVLARTS